MRRITIILLMFTVWTVMVARTSFAVVGIRLREHVVVRGEEVTLADVAEIADGAPQRMVSLVLGNAPRAGYTRNMNRALLKVRLASSGFSLKGLELTGAEVCVVERAAVCVESAEISAVAERFVREQYPGGGPQVSIEVVRAANDVHLPVQADPIRLLASAAGSGPPVGDVRVYVDIVSGGQRLERTGVQLRVRRHQEVAVARRAIHRGEKFTDANVAFIRRETTDVSAECVARFSALDGRAAERSIQPGQLITTDVVARSEEPIVVELNQRVVLLAETATMRAVTVGQSLTRARRGEVARAKNLASGREVVGIAIGEGTIKVIMDPVGEGVADAR